MLPRRTPLAHGPGRRHGRALRVRRPADSPPTRTPRGREDSVIRRFLAVVVAALAIVPVASATRVHVRVEGKTQTIFGPTAPAVDVNANALDALAAGAIAGEVYYHLHTT